MVVPLFIKPFPWKPWLGGFTLVFYPIIAYFLLSGGSFGLEHVETPKWGGLMLTLILAGSMLLCLPWAWLDQDGPAAAARLRGRGPRRRPAQRRRRARSRPATGA